LPSFHNQRGWYLGEKLKKIYCKRGNLITCLEKKEPINLTNAAVKVFMDFVKEWKQPMAVKFYQAVGQRAVINYPFLMNAEIKNKPEFKSEFTELKNYQNLNQIEYLTTA
jgi:hypothetical protein